MTGERGLSVPIDRTCVSSMKSEGVVYGMERLEEVEKGREMEKWSTKRRWRGRWMREVMAGVIYLGWRGDEEASLGLHTLFP